MLIEHQKEIQTTIECLREEIGMMITQLSEDPRNEPVCKKLRAIREKRLVEAGALARIQKEGELSEAIHHSEYALKLLIDLDRDLSGYTDKDGSYIPPQLHIYPLPQKPISQDKIGAYFIENEGADNIRNYQPMLSHDEVTHITQRIRTLPAEIGGALKSCNGDLSRLSKLHHRHTRTKITSQPLNHIYRLEMALHQTQELLAPPNNQPEHPNHPIFGKVQTLIFMLELAKTPLLAIVDAKGHQIVPGKNKKDIAEDFDHILKSTYQLFHSEDMENAASLRNNTQSSLALKASIRSVKSCITEAAQQLEDQGMPCPNYRAISKPVKQR